MDLTLALQKRVVEFCKELSHKDLQELALYLGAKINKKEKPTQLQQKFCEQFLGIDNYIEYLRFVALPKEKQPCFTTAFKTGNSVSEMYNFVSWQCCLRMSNLFCELTDERVKSSKLNLKLADKKVETAKLREELSKAIVNSYEGNIFYKDNGWCNISEVLVKHKLIDLDYK